ncbi:MAG: Crp/Fnr family transcriptional regulator [Chitinophagaceae bacterium]
MSLILEQYLHEKAGLSAADVARTLAAAQVRSLQRGTMLLQEGQICRYKIFVADGLLRNYAVAADGSEHILQFCPELHWTLDVESYDHQTPARFNIDAIEASEVYLWSKDAFHQLLHEIPALEAFSRQLVSRNIYNSRHRLVSALSATPEEKYQEFLNSYPGLLSRVPLRMIASYLGVSLKTLGRIRQASARH